MTLFAKKPTLSREQAEAIRRAARPDDDANYGDEPTYGDHGILQVATDQDGQFVGLYDVGLKGTPDAGKIFPVPTPK